MRALLALLALLALALAGCDNADPDGAALTEPAYWELAASSIAPLPSRATVSFGRGGDAEGLLICNDYLGSFVASGATEGSIQIEVDAITEAACGGDLRGQDEYLAALRAVDTFEVIDGRVLRLRGSGGVLLEYVLPERE